jgi:hypothetical protein
MSDLNLVSVSPAVREAFTPVIRVIGRARQDLASQLDICAAAGGRRRRRRRRRR